MPIGVYQYSDPDPSAISPFHERLRCIRSIALDKFKPITGVAHVSRIETLWGHVREGSTDPHALFKYLQIAKSFAIEAEKRPEQKLPKILKRELDSEESPVNYLCNASGDSFHDRVWRFFWMTHVFHEGARTIWRKSSGRYEVNAAPSKLKQPDGSAKMFFVGRADSIKNRLVDSLNRGDITEAQACAEFAKNVHDRAHSYREDIDSGLAALGLLEGDGKPTELGYRFVDSCERSKTWDSGTPRMILSAALIQNASFGAFLHYVHRLSEERFRKDPYAFQLKKGATRLDLDSYKEWLEDRFANELRIMHKVSARGGMKRKPFQAELAILRQFGLVNRFRIGVGLEIDWVNFQEALEFKL